MIQSKLRFFSIGRVVEPKLVNSDQIVVRAVELHPFFEGELKADPGKIKAEGTDATGKKYIKEIETDIGIIAKWLPMDSGNRATPPDVRRNERVMIWQYEQQDEYYWTCMGLDSGYRRLETVVYRFSNTKDESVVKLDDSNSWWFELSTHKKTITLKTNNSDGEKYTYGILIDAKTGAIKITDNLNNSILLDSANTLIELENANETLVSLNKKTILLKAIDSVTIDTKDFIVKSKTSTVNGSSTIDLKGGTVTIDGTQMTTKPKSNFNATVSVKGSTDIGGDLKVTGGSVKHKSKEIGMTHSHTPPGGPVA